MSAAAPPGTAFEVRVRGAVQGVGFRPTVFRLAREGGLRGEVRNDGQGVLIHVGGAAAEVLRFLHRLRAEAPPLAHIESIESRPLARLDAALPEFRIVASASGEVHTQVAPDAATCAACRTEVADPFARRYRYPFTNCTHCGPRFTIVRGLPYDRAQTTMAGFALCAECRSEYDDPADRRFHAQPIACHRCGPRARLVRTDGAAVSHEQFSMLDDVDAVATLIRRGEIVAVRGLGGFHLACDATQAAVVERLRAGKERQGKPFALMARDLDVVRRYARVDAPEEALLLGVENPIVLLRAQGEALPLAVSPGLRTLGFMLPSTPLHHLLFKRLAVPVVMTSGNPSGQPQATANEDALARLGPIASYALLHDREIAHRLDDSVARVVMGEPRLLRRARGYAPAPLPLPPGFEKSDGILALGGELKSTFCLVKDGAAVLSPHHGDLEDAHTYDEYVRNLDTLGVLFQHRPRLLAADLHPEYLSAKLGRRRAAAEGLPLLEVQHHHAHVASCLVEHGLPRDTLPVLGVALDGLGWGGDGTFWGGEFLLADYRGYERLGTFKPVALLGGAQAMREPWRNTYAHLMAEMGWTRLAMNYGELELFRFLEEQPRPLLDQMLASGTGAPPASSCGRLFDAVAAALGLCRGRASFEGQAAMELEAIVDERVLEEEDDALIYPFAIPRLHGKGLPYVEPLGFWEALLGDLILGTPAPVIAARFHRSLARVIAGMVTKLLPPRVEQGAARPTVALTGGCFQNPILLEQTVRALGGRFEVLTHARVPASDGGLALGQAAIAAAVAQD
jgi:hydrogenase maturation protein HypF